MSKKGKWFLPVLASRKYACPMRGKSFIAKKLSHQTMRQVQKISCRKVGVE